LLAGAAPSKVSARAPNLAVAFLDAPLFFFAPRGTISVLVLDCAPSRPAPLVNAIIALIKMTAAHGRPIFSMLIRCSSVTVRKSIVERQRNPSAWRLTF
jgi:hypothetical protein